MAKVTAEEYAEKWARRLKGSTEDIRLGVSKVTIAPGLQAAKSADKMLANLTAAITSGMWANQVAKVSLEEWKEKFNLKGIGRIAAGVDAASASQVLMAQKLLKAVDESAAIANALPKVTLEDSINRMTTFVREMNKRKLRK